MLGSVVTLGMSMPTRKPAIRRVTQYSRLLSQTRTTFILAVITLLGGGAAAACLDPDPSSVRGALDVAARAVEAGDGRALYRAIDRRSTDALSSIAKDRASSAALIRGDYPADEAPAALRALGDALGHGDGAGLFAERCSAVCMAEIASQLGAPVRQTQRGVELEIETSRGGKLRLHRERGVWGIVWRTEELYEERRSAAHELVQIRANAEIYRRRRALEKTPG